MTERKYAMTKLAPGDYLLPSNDGRTLWRVSVYTDGPSMGLQDMPSDRDFWQLRRWHEEIGPGSYVDTLDWDRWELDSDMHKTRAAAIEAALAQGGPS